MTRTSTAVIVIANTVNKAGEERTTHYGPFLPHAGGATTTFINKLDADLTDSDLYTDHEITVETLFIGEGESDCTVVATR